MALSGRSAFFAERERLAADLRRAREATGLSTRAFAERLGWSQSKVTHIENQRRTARPDDVTAWSVAAGLSAEQAADLVERATRSQAELQNWRYAAEAVPAGLAGIQREVEELERQATVFRVYEPFLIPGLLQTPEYARRVFLAGVPEGPAIAEAVAARLARQTALYDATKRFEFVVPEAALRWRVGPPPVMAAQIDRIRQVATLGNVWLGVIPVDVEASVWRYHGFTLYDEPRETTPLVIVETLGHNLSISEEPTVERYRAAFRTLQELAATGSSGSSILDRLLADLTH